MNKNLLLAIIALLIAIAAMEGYEINQLKNCCMDDNNTIVVNKCDSGACNDSARYNDPNPQPQGGTEITSGVRQQMINDYNPTPTDFRGCFISKLALDHMFANDIRANGLLIEVGQVAGSTNKTLIFSTRRTNFYKLGALGPPPSSNIFMSDKFCPPECMTQ